MCLNLSLLLSLRFKFGRVGTLGGGVEFEFGFEFGFELSFRIGRVGTLEFGFKFEIEFEFQNW